MTTEQKVDAIVNIFQAAPEQEEQLRRVLSDPETGKAPEIKPNVLAYQMLTELGTPCHIKGYRYLVAALGMVVEHPEYIEAVTKQLYPRLAREFGATPSRVERSIRHAIEVTWDRGDLQTLQNAFGNSIDRDKGKPTNSEFISRTAEVMRMRLRGEM